MSEVQREGDLEINQNLDFQRRMWVVQRVGWTVMALVTLAALLGLFGVGVLSNGTVGSRGAPISIEEYERFLRFMKPTPLRVHLGPGAGTRGEVFVWIDREYLENMQLQQINPQPDRVEAGSDRLTYVFEVGDPDGPTAITFNLQPQKIGRLEGRVGLDGRGSLTFSQFVYP